MNISIIENISHTKKRYLSLIYKLSSVWEYEYILKNYTILEKIDKCFRYFLFK